jgi:hypothetical protein
MNNNLIEIDGIIINLDDLKHKKGRKSKKDLLLLEKIKAKQLELGIYKEDEPKVHKKKGRKPKIVDQSLEKKIPKKRGRKPKGGKIVNITEINDNKHIFKTNIILHLKCKSSDIIEKNNFIGDLNYNPSIEHIQPFNNGFDDNVTFINKENNENTNTNGNITFINKEIDNNLHFEKNIQLNNQNDTEQQIINNNSLDNKYIINIDNEEKSNYKDIWTKLKQLQNKLKMNKLVDKKSSCFWCTYDFDNLPIYIPKCYINNSYEVYGCFCTPECACSYLCNEKIDSSTRWERYSLLNSIYGKIYDYTKNIKPAPDPHYLLDKFYGDLTIEEFRKLNKTDNLLLVVEKPLTKVLPEIHDESNEMPNINFNKKNNVNKNKVYRLSRNKPAITQNNNNTNWTT